MSRAQARQAAADAMRAKVCAAEAEAQHFDYRQRLLRGARIDWRRPAVAAALGQRVVERLPDRKK